jgi:hypothetical protein
MQAIKTKIIPATNTKPTRIKATSCGGISVTLSTSNIEGDQHIAAVRALCEKLKWKGKMVMGGLTKDGDCVAVFATDRDTIEV